MRSTISTLECSILWNCFTLDPQASQCNLSVCRSYEWKKEDFEAISDLRSVVLLFWTYILSLLRSACFSINSHVYPIFQDLSLVARAVS